MFDSDLNWQKWILASQEIRAKENSTEYIWTRSICRENARTSPVLICLSSRSALLLDFLFEEYIQDCKNVYGPEKESQVRKQGREEAWMY